MRLLLAAAWLVVPVSLGPFLACSDEKEGWLSGDTKRSIDRELAPYGEELGFEIITPEYLPQGTQPKPLPYPSPVGSIAFIFNAAVDPNLPLHNRASVEITEARAGTFATDILPNDPIAGKTVGIGRSESTSRVAISMNWEQDGLVVVVSVSWDTPSNGALIALTQAMEDEAYLVAESMIRQ